MSLSTSFDPDRVETVTVDSYGTLVDPSAVEDELASRIENPTAVSDTWRAQSLLYTMVANHLGYYQPFYEMNRDALQYALDFHGAEMSSDEREDVLAQYHELEVFDDTRAGIERLRNDGYPVYVVSNGNPEMLESMVEYASIEELVEDTISAEEIRTFKPDEEIYRHAAARTGTPIENIAHVAGPVFDVQGAIHAGMQGVWLDRGGAPWGRFDGEPDLRIESFHDLVDEL